MYTAVLQGRCMYMSSKYILTEDEAQLKLCYYRAERDRIVQDVLRVVHDMENHFLGVEGMEDSPVARWSSELYNSVYPKAVNSSFNYSMYVDLNGEEINLHDTLYSLDSNKEYTVVGFNPCKGEIVVRDKESGYMCNGYSKYFQHNPVLLDCKGKPIQKGQTVLWKYDTCEFTVLDIKNIDSTYYVSICKTGCNEESLVEDVLVLSNDLTVVE